MVYRLNHQIAISAVACWQLSYLCLPATRCACRLLVDHLLPFRPGPRHRASPAAKSANVPVSRFTRPFRARTRPYMKRRFIRPCEQDRQVGHPISANPQDNPPVLWQARSIPSWMVHPSVAGKCTAMTVLAVGNGNTPRHLPPGAPFSLRSSNDGEDIRHHLAADPHSRTDPSHHDRQPIPTKRFRALAQIA